MCGSRKFFQRGSIFFLQIPLKSGHHRPTSETSYKWRFAGPTLSGGLVAVWFFGGSKKPYIFVIFQGRGGGRGGDPLSPIWIRTWTTKTEMSCRIYRSCCSGGPATRDSMMYMGNSSAKTSMYIELCFWLLKSQYDPIFTLCNQASNNERQIKRPLITCTKCGNLVLHWLTLS